MRSVKRIIKIHNVEGYLIHCLFNNGESRIIDFTKLFKTWKVGNGDIEELIATQIVEFAKVELIDGTLTWKNLSIKGFDENGSETIAFYDIDPIVLYENSVLDSSRETEIGLLIKRSRTDLGITQVEFAKRSGTTKHYISRIENNRTGIELSTLKRIIEGGLGRKMQISIQ